MERTVTMHGNPLSLGGQALKVGDRAPDFNVVDNNLGKTGLSAFRDKVLVISAVPSLDTPVCDVETRRFNVEAGKLGKDVAVLTISMDLPFAQKRWCGAAGVSNVTTLSDHADASFGLSYGVLLKDLRLLARAVFVVDKGGIIRHAEVVDEITKEPDYEACLKAVAECLK
ncbi:MAG: thiol peroxidase [Desulfobacteraceae bacterium]|nr:thiol peroxidase [Desulfobacteraceae bacterium]